MRLYLGGAKKTKLNEEKLSSGGLFAGCIKSPGQQELEKSPKLARIRQN
jgi:hypothetical protein